VETDDQCETDNENEVNEEEEQEQEDWWNIDYILTDAIDMYIQIALIWNRTRYVYNTKCIDLKWWAFGRRGRGYSFDLIWPCVPL
jgi:hypothetical protein